MNQRRIGVRNIGIGVAIIILVLVGAALFTAHGSPSAKPAATPVSSVAVVVAQYPIPQGTTFQSGQDLTSDFAVRQMPSNDVPFGAYTSLKDVQDFLATASCGPVSVPGCRGVVTASETIFQNEPVISGMLSSLGAYRTSAGPAFQIPYGYVAIAVSLNTVNSVESSISPGDDVDLIASFTGQGKGMQNLPTQTQYVLNDVRVIGVGGPPSQPPPPPPSTPVAGAPAAAATPQPTPTPVTSQGAGTLVLLVRYQEALIIQHMKDFAQTWSMSVVLRSAKETDIPHFRTLPVTERWFFVKQANHFDMSNPY